MCPIVVAFALLKILVRYMKKIKLHFDQQYHSTIKGKIIYKATAVSFLINLHFPSNLNFSFRASYRTNLLSCVEIGNKVYF